jgi:hypothetical protein
MYLPHDKTGLFCLVLGIVVVLGLGIAFVLNTQSEDDPPWEGLYDPRLAARTKTGEACLWKGKTAQRFLPSMKQGSNESPLNISRTLVIYNYFETSRAKGNTEFFLEHGMFFREDVDWLFVANSHMCLELPDHPSVGLLFRDNTCFDLGTYKEVILKYELHSKYGRIVTMNASVRGPFMPTWSNECWLDKFTEKLGGTVKAVSTTVNCQSLEMTLRGNGWSVPWSQHRPHMQSMVLVMDREGVLPLLSLYRCFSEKFDAIFEGESRNLIQLLRHNYTIFSLYSEFAKDQQDWKKCHHFAPESIHPYEVIFIKVVDTVIPDLVEAVTRSNNARITRAKQFCAPIPERPLPIIK